MLQVNGATLKQVEKFKYLGVAFTSDGRQNEELDTRISCVRRTFKRGGGGGGGEARSQKFGEAHKNQMRKMKTKKKVFTQIQSVFLPEFLPKFERGEA